MARRSTNSHAEKMNRPPPELAVPDRKSIVASRSFGRQMTVRSEVEESVTAFASRAATKLRRQGLATSHLSVFIETNPFREQDPQYTASRGVSLAVATADTGKLIAAAQRALGEVWREGYRYKKAGVMLVDLVRANTVSSRLFDSRDDGRLQARMKALDGLNARFGRDTVAFARTARARPWHMRSNMLSARYTTDWDELLTV